MSALPGPRKRYLHPVLRNAVCTGARPRLPFLLCLTPACSGQYVPYVGSDAKSVSFHLPSRPSGKGGVDKRAGQRKIFSQCSRIEEGNSNICGRRRCLPGAAFDSFFTQRNSKNTSMQLFSRKQKNEEKELLAGDPHDPDYIVYCLEYAMDLRSCLHLDFFIGHRQSSQLRSVCVAVDRQRFIVNLLDDVPSCRPPGWKLRYISPSAAAEKVFPAVLKQRFCADAETSPGNICFLLCRSIWNIISVVRMFVSTLSKKTSPDLPSGTEIFLPEAMQLLPPVCAGQEWKMLLSGWQTFPPEECVLRCWIPAGNNTRSSVQGRTAGKRGFLRSRQEVVPPFCGWNYRKS